MHLQRFRSFFSAFAGAFLIVSGIVPKADAQILVAYFNFEDGGPLGSTNIDLTSDMPPGTQSPTLTINTPGLPPPVNVAGLPLNVAPGDGDPNLLAVGFKFTPTVAPSADLTFGQVNTLGLTNLSLSFAIKNDGNGFSTATFKYSLTGQAGPFITDGTVTLPPPPGGNQIVTFNYSTAVDNHASVYFQISLTGGASQGTNLQTVIDNIQLNAVPEPATAASAVLAVFGICWFRRRSLIRFLLLRRSTGRLHRTLG